MSKRVLIIGGYGVFGGRLAMALAKDSSLDVIVAGRSLSKAEAFCAKHGGRALKLDLYSDSLEADIADADPDILVDAAGPYQTYGDAPYRVAKAAIAARAHYLDLSDVAGFTASITALNKQAVGAKVAVLSGVSSVPALSSAIVADLSSDLDSIDLIESAILPGNKAPRGKSVMRSILAQAGQDVPVWRGGAWTSVKGWSDQRRIDLKVKGHPPILKRRASYIGAPDLNLFPEHFKARSVLFRAGLDLAIMHKGLSALSHFVRWGVMQSAAPLTAPLKWAADILEPYGSDRGGMLVRVIGGRDGKIVERKWTLIAEAGDGPHIPAIPARIMVRKLLAAEVAPGARPCLTEFTRDEAEVELATLSTFMGSDEAPLSRIFEEALGNEFKYLPAPLKRLHTLVDQQLWQGEATITRGAGIVSRIAGALAGFPAAGDSVPVNVMQQRTANGEDWTRQFGTGTFVSHLSRKPGSPPSAIYERFGLMKFEIGLELSEDGLRYPVKRGWLCGVPLPRFLLPKSDTVEGATNDGRTTFDVSVSLPIAGHVVRYKGWLRPVDQAVD